MYLTTIYRGENVSPISILTSEIVAFVCVFILALIVIWDAFWLTKQRNDVPTLGELPNLSFAWASEGVHEVARQWGNLFSMAAMMALPWALLSASNTPVLYAILWDVFLGLHLVSLLVPKRYAVTPTHLFADGQRYEWSRLKMPKKQPKSRIMLLRMGWGPFAPLPLGGQYHDLEIAKQRIRIFKDVQIDVENE